MREELGKIISSLQSTRDRMSGALTPRFGEAFDGDFDVMLDAINALKRVREKLRALAAQCGEPAPDPVAWALVTGQGTALALTKPACELDYWRPLVFGDRPSQPVALPPDWAAVPRRWTREMLDAFYRFCPHTDALYIHQAVSAAIAAAPAGEGVGNG